MPILLMGVVALIIFLVLGGMFFAAMEAEHHKRKDAEKCEDKGSAQIAGR